MADSAPSQLTFPDGSALRLRIAIDLVRGAAAKLTAVFADMTDDDPTDPKYKPLADEIHLLDNQQDRLRGLLREAERQELRRQTGADR